MLNDPQFPERPQHPDFWLLSDVILQLDAAGDENPNAFEDIVGTTIDIDSLHYMAHQRALRAHAVANGYDPREGRIPRELVEGRRNRHTILSLSAAYMEAFIVGYRFAKKKDSRDG